MKNIKSFETQELCDNFKTSPDYVTPNVFLIGNDNIEFNNSFDPANGHEWIEINGIKWATINVGANSITDPGTYFYPGDFDETVWGGSWRVPTQSELRTLIDTNSESPTNYSNIELIENYENNGSNVYKVYDPTDNTKFLIIPVSGVKDASTNLLQNETRGVIGSKEYTTFGPTTKAYYALNCMNENDDLHITTSPYSNSLMPIRLILDI